MKIPLYQVDAFSRTVFGGNPAAVCPLESWIYDATMQKIAAENALSETAFLVPRGDEWEIRWFTPVQEVELCGHATLGSGYVVLTHLAPKREIVRFDAFRDNAPLRAFYRRLGYVERGPFKVGTIPVVCFEKELPR